MKAFEELKARLAAVEDLASINRLLTWDQLTQMPPGGAEARAEQAATLTRLVHEQFVSPEIGRVLEELRAYEDGLPPESDEASVIRVTRRDWEKATRVPPDLSAEIRAAGARGEVAWAEARAADNFELVRPHLERNLELKHRYIECFDPTDEPYDLLLDAYEEGLKTAEVRAVFERLKSELTPLVRGLDAQGGGELDVDLPERGQTEFVLEVLHELGFDERTWRLDPTAHPFMSTPGFGDVRITLFYPPRSLNSIFAAIHEFGHGLYEHQVDPALARTPLGTGASAALHESQSRMWENLVGRSRPFWRCFFPRLAKSLPTLANLGEEGVYEVVNRLTRSPIRIDADEVTYNLHVVLRFELELELIDGRLPVSELPEAWNRRMEEYLGIEIERDAEGVLQDIHWPSGMIGYFPSYALGTVMSVQIWRRVAAELGELDRQIERGEFGPLRDWLTENLYRFGRKFTPRETLERAAGAALDPEPYLEYLRAKHFSQS